LTTSDGYLTNFEVYQGRMPDAEPELEEQLGKCEAPLMNFISNIPDPYKHQPLSFFFDNLFTSVPLLTKLAELGYKGKGTIRQNEQTSQKLQLDLRR
jgi:hypothetical protein